MEDLSKLLEETRRLDTQSARVIATAFYRLNEIHQTASWAYPTFDDVREKTQFDPVTGDLLEALRDKTASIQRLHRLIADGVLAEAATILCETEIMVGCALIEQQSHGQVDQQHIHETAHKDERMARMAALIARSSLTSAAPINFLLAERIVSDKALLTHYENNLVDGLEVIYNQHQ